MTSMFRRMGLRKGQVLGLVVGTGCVLFVLAHIQVSSLSARWQHHFRDTVSHLEVFNSEGKSAKNGQQFAVNKLEPRQGKHEDQTDWYSLLPSSSPIWDGRNLGELYNVTATAFSNTMNRKTAHTSAIDTSFHPGLNSSERTAMAEILRAFMKAAEANHVTYFLYSGSLLGSLRHHGMVPWDDDVDVAVNISHKHRLKEALNRDLPFGFVFNSPESDSRWKVWYEGTTKINKNITWNFPFLDISFFREVNGQIKDADKYFQDRFVYNASWIFPLTRRPFWDMWLPAPRKSLEMIKVTYNINKCISKNYSHKIEKWVAKVIVLNCEVLHKHYPFVTRRSLSKTVVKETLEVNGSVQGWSII